jgi:hypothetical protein
VRRQALAAVVVAVGALAGCDAGDTKIIGAQYPAAMCMTALAPPAGVDAFYTKYRDANGIPVLSSGVVQDEALEAACIVVVRMLSARDDVRQAMIALQMRVAVIGRNQVTTTMPEYRNLYQMFPMDDDWDMLRGVGATRLIPVSSAGEENLLCLADDSYAGENNLVHTFATAVLLGLEDADATFDARLQAAYDAARSAGLWQGTTVLKNPIQYFAEGVQDWFDAKPNVSPADGVHNEINTRGELQAYDPNLASLVEEGMPADAWRPKCP